MKTKAKATGTVATIPFRSIITNIAFLLQRIHGIRVNHAFEVK
ncbi:hypothetical protein CCACVL1_05938 [Corchorus capsularis]|uniref:Uncharacterized protein n=1 Tax=Corchorus capsularis TaxID=210143 RepID=A0A1R3JI73_COCAP|nr:hypothetical protein CCACVL1_05938 [Corchorus capsularis]